MTFTSIISIRLGGGVQLSAIQDPRNKMYVAYGQLESQRFHVCGSGWKLVLSRSFSKMVDICLKTTKNLQVHCIYSRMKYKLSKSPHTPPPCIVLRSVDNIRP